MSHPTKAQRAKTQREHDLAILAAGGITGWWDEHGRPFPDEFFDPDTEWRPTSSDTPPVLADREQPI